MKTLHSLIFLLIFFCTVKAQEQSTFLPVATAKGMFLLFERPDLLGHDLDVYRKGGTETTFRKVATLSALKSESELRSRITEAQSIFTPEDGPKPEQVPEVWRAYLQSRDTLSGLVAGVPPLAYVFNIAYLDKEVKEGTPYEYQIKEGQKLVGGTERVLYTAHYRFPDLSAARDTTSSMSIIFSLPFSEQLLKYVSVQAKRKLFTDRQTEFQPVILQVSLMKRKKLRYITLTDASLKTYSEYNYQLTMKNIFGEMDTVRYSFDATNVPFQYASKIKLFKVTSSKESRAFKISWQLRHPERIYSLALYRSDKFEGPYTMITHLNPKDSVALDPISIANELYFYYLEVADIFGNGTKTIKVHAVYNGNHIPKAPVDLQVNSSSAGPALTWKSSDPHTRGFYVFRRRGLSGEFRQISPFEQVMNNKGMFIDSTRLDADNTYYYTVKAESDTYDKSNHSDTVSFRPTAVLSALKPPLDINAVFRQQKILLVWENMNRLIPSVAGYRVYRKKESDSSFTLLTRNKMLYQNSFADSIGLSAAIYQYSIVCEDGAGNQSKQSLPVSIDLRNTFIISPEKLGFERMTTAIKIKWTSIDVQQIQSIKIYRAEEDRPFLLLSTIKADRKDFTDNAVVRGKVYKYRLVIVNTDRKETDPTDTIVVPF